MSKNFPQLFHGLCIGDIYYVSVLSSGMTEDTYYLNGSNCIKRRKLDGTGKEEYLMPLECGMDMRLLYMKAKGF